jgi:hypothetical protein
MTYIQSPLALPLAMRLVTKVTRAQVAAGEPEDPWPLIGASDVEADAALSGAPADLTHVMRDGDGVPVGEDDLAADRRNSGA